MIAGLAAAAILLVATGVLQRIVREVAPLFAARPGQPEPPVFNDYDRFQYNYGDSAAEHKEEIVDTLKEAKIMPTQLKSIKFVAKKSLGRL